MINTYRIETERLVIRCYEPQDTSQFLDAVVRSADHLHPWMNWAKEKQTMEDKASQLRKWRGNYDLGIDYVLGVFAKDGKTFIGSTGWSIATNNAVEIGYWIDVKYKGNGFMTEAVKALVKVAFAIESFERVTILCVPENTGSRNIPIRLGFNHEGTLSQRGRDGDGVMRDEEVWSLFKQDYEKSEIKDMELRVFDFIGQKINL